MEIFPFTDFEFRVKILKYKMTTPLAANIHKLSNYHN